MAVLVDATKSGEYANSYATVSEADSYFEAHFDTGKATAWEALDDGQKQILLVNSTMLLEQLRFTVPVTRQFYELQYNRVTNKVTLLTIIEEPVKYSYFQNLQFPRNIDIDSNSAVSYIPEAVKIAQFEQALTLKNFSETTITKITSGIKSESVDIAGQISRAITYQDGATSGFTVFGATMSPVAVQFLSPYILRNTKVRRA